MEEERGEQEVRRRYIEKEREKRKWRKEEGGGTGSKEGRKGARRKSKLAYPSQKNAKVMQRGM